MLFKGNSSRLELLIGKIQAHKESPSPPRDDKCVSVAKDVLGTGSSSWHSEDGVANSRRGGETPSSCATPTSASFPSEPEVDAEIGVNADGNGTAAPYPCQFCDRTFPRLSYLKKHEQSHGDQMPYRCSWCARLFKHKRSRDRHVKLHTGDRRYRCSHCEAAFSRSDHLKIHMKTHDNQKPYQCTACSRGYNTAAALTSHMQSHKKNQSPGQGAKLELDYGRRSVSSHSTSSPPMPNSPCPSFGTSANPKNSPKTQQSSYNISGLAPTTPVLSSPLKLACMYCTRDSFTSMQQLQMHVSAMHRSILSGENLSMPSPCRVNRDAGGSRSRETEGSDVDPRRDGETAGRRDDRERSTELEKVDAGGSSFSCGQCTMKFSNLGSLREHLTTIHRNDGFGPASMMCPLCGVPCGSAATYAEHYVLRHCESRSRVPSGDPGRRDWDEGRSNGRRESVRPGSKTRCVIAGSSEIGPSEPADLTKKQQSRSGDSGYSAGTLLCGQCGAALKDFESFREHLARHLQADQQGGSGDAAPRNPCPKCEAVFPDREDMLVHLTKHYLGRTTKEYACGACKKSYPHPDLLQRHLLDTHAHHLYRCALCRDTFDSRVAIQVHFAVKHSQECRIYRCSTCSLSNNENSPGNAPLEGRCYFRSEAEMASHVRSVHAPPGGASESPLPRSRASTPGISGNVSRCVFCGISCTTDLELQLHLASHSTSLYRCPICREGFPVEFLLDRHVAQVHRVGSDRADGRENGRSREAPRSLEETSKSQKRGRSPASSNNNSLNQRDNNSKRPNFGPTVATSPTTSLRHTCELCERGEFASEAELLAHKKLVHAPVKLQSKSLTSLSMTCAYCGEVCRSRGELESHTRIQHASNEPGGRHKCNICDEVCPSGGILAEHKLRKHCKIQLSDCCIVCRGSLGNEAQFMEHLRRHSLEGPDSQQRSESALGHLPAACVVCRQTLISDLECRLHARHHLRGTSGFQSSSSSPSPSQPKTQQKKQRQQQQQQEQQDQQRTALSCCLCLREFGADDFVSLPSNPAGSVGPSLRVCKSCYVRHSQGLPILSSPYEHARPSRSEKTNWAPVGKEATYREGSSDPWDNERFCKAEKKSRNPAGAKDSDDDRCVECGIKFESAEESESHRAKEHGKNCRSNTYTCIQCQMSFPSEEMIQQHVRKDHLESPSKASMEALRCHLCHFEANSPLQLQGHLIEHTFAGCAGLTCYICQALFTTSIALQNHMLQRHGLGARPYDCSYCALKFFFRIELDHHVATVHRRKESAAPSVNVDPNVAKEGWVGDGREDDDRSENVTVKEEIANSPEDEDVNVDDNVEQPEDDETKHEDRNHVNAKEEPFAIPRVEEKIEC